MNHRRTTSGSVENLLLKNSLTTNLASSSQTEKKKFRMIPLWMIIFIFILGMIPIATALPGIELNTTLNQETFYTLPLLGTTTLEHVINTADNGTGIDAAVEIDFVKGIAHRGWWDSNYIYRKPIRFNLPSDYNSNKTIVLNFNITNLVNSGKLRSDFNDLRLVENDVVVPIKMEENDGVLQLMFRTENYTSLKNMDIYYGNPGMSTIPDYESAYRFYENFNNLDRWNITSGAYNILGNSLNSFEGQKSRIMLINYSGIYDNTSSITSSVPAIIDYKLMLADNASSSIILAENYNLSGKNINITLNAASENQTICISGNCQKYYANISSDEWVDVKIEVTSSVVSVMIDDAIYTKTHELTDYYLAFENNNVVSIDEFTVMKKSSPISPIIYDEQKLLQKINSATFGGIYGWSYDITGYETGTYSIWTKTTKTNYVSNLTLDIINIEYNKIGVAISEKGKVTKIGDKYVSDVTGTVTFTNPNHRNVSLNVLYDSELQFIDLYGDHFTGNAIVYSPLLASNSHTIEYFITGITYRNPILSSQSVLGTAISRASGLSDYYEFTQNSLTSEVKSVAPKQEVESGKIIISKSDTQFTLESFATTYGGLPFIITKSVSQRYVLPGDVIEVSIKVNNVDVVSKVVNIKEVIPPEFVHIIGTNIPTKQKILNWNFDMNKGSSKIVSYKMMYIGNSTGIRVILPSVVTFDVYNMTSNNVTIFRDIPKSTDIYVQKNIKYLGQRMARIEINVVNKGDKTIEELHVSEFIGNAEFKEESIKTPFKGEWIVRDLNPGESWKVSYLTKNHELIENLPNVFSYEDDVKVSSELFIDNDIEEEKPLWKEQRGFLIPSILIFILISELLAAGYYIYSNMKFYSQGTQDFNIKNYLLKILKDFFDMIIDIPNSFKRIYKNASAILKYFRHNFIMTIRIIQIWFGSKLPIWWKIYDKLRVLNKYEWFLFLKMIVDYLKKGILTIIKTIGNFIQPILKDVENRAKKDIEERKATKFAPPKEEQPKVVMRPEDVLAEKEALEKYKESQEMLNNLLNDFKK